MGSGWCPLAEPPDGPGGVAGLAEVRQRPEQLLDGVEEPHPGQAPLQRADEPLRAAVAFRSADEGRGASGTQERQLVLEDGGHALAAVVVADAEPGSGAPGDGAGALAHPLGGAARAPRSGCRVGRRGCRRTRRCGGPRRRAPRPGLPGSRRWSCRCPTSCPGRRERWCRRGCAVRGVCRPARMPAGRACAAAGAPRRACAAATSGHPDHNPPPLPAEEALAVLPEEPRDEGGQCLAPERTAVQLEHVAGSHRPLERCGAAARQGGQPVARRLADGRGAVLADADGGGRQHGLPVALEAVMNLAATRCLRQESKTLLFLKKKKQKDFAYWDSGARAAPEINGPKFFGSFFQERTRFRLRAASGVEAGRLMTGAGWRPGCWWYPARCR